MTEARACQLDQITIEVVRDPEADQDVEVVTAVAGQEDLALLEPGTAAYAQRAAELAGDLDDETEEEAR